MRKLQVQGVHHITLAGADRQTSIDFWEGLLGMPFIFDQLNLDNPGEGHLYFDPGDGRLVTIFTNEDRTWTGHPKRPAPGEVHHLAFALSRAVFSQAVEQLDERWIGLSGVKNRGASAIAEIHLADAIERLIARRQASLSEDRGPKNPCRG